MTDFDRNVPIYLQIAETITKKILSGLYAPGEKLPSVRDIAAAEGVNPNTAQRALTSLETEQILVTERTSGRFVTTDESLIEEKRNAVAQGLTTEYKKNMQEIGFDESKLISLFGKGE